MQEPTRQRERERGISIRGTVADPEPVSPRLPTLHGGVVWAGREWPAGTGGPKAQQRLPTIVCFGDSHTQGQLGANWVDLLQSKFMEQFRFVNCGVNGQVLESIRQRVEPTLAAHGPDVVGVIVMGGTNDALANLNPSSRKLIRVYNPHLPRLPPLVDFSRILEELVAAVHAHCSPFLHILVMTPPLLGEDPDALENEAIDQVCDAIRNIVRKLTKKPRSSTSGGGTSTGSGGGGRERRASSSASGLREDGRIESVTVAVTVDGAPLAMEQDRHPHCHHAPHTHRRRDRSHSRDRRHQHHRRLHVIDWNRHMRRYVDRAIDGWLGLTLVLLIRTTDDAQIL